MSNDAAMPRQTVNRWTRGRVVWPGRLGFGGGWPSWTWGPRVVAMRTTVHVFLWGTELIWERRRQGQ